MYEGKACEHLRGCRPRPAPFLPVHGLLDNVFLYTAHSQTG